MKKLFCLLALIALPAFAAEKAPAPAVLRVGTFNIRVPNDPPPNNWAMRFPRVKALLQKQPLDIIGMQETTAQQLDDLLTLPGWASIGVAREDGIRRGPHHLPRREAVLHQHGEAARHGSGAD